MAKSVLFDAEESTVESTTETSAITRVLRPTLPLPAKLRAQATSFYAAKDERQAQYKAWSPEMGMHVRIFGAWAEAIFAKYGARYVQGEDTEKGVTLLICTHTNSNGLHFESTGEVDAHGNVQRGYVSLNEYSIDTVELYTPSITLK